MAKILIVGCGDIGAVLGKLLAESGHHVTGLKRNPPPFGQRPFNYVQADISQLADLDSLETDFERIVFIVSANRRDLESYRKIYEVGIDNLIRKFSATRLRAPWIFVSSTSVYGQNRGEWVDENSPAQGDSASSRQILAAEQKILDFNPLSTVVRFSGIYGPAREYLLKVAGQKPVIQQYPPYYTNRIHQRDCVGVLEFLLAQSLTGVQLAQHYLASDNNPAPMWEVMSWLCEQIGVDQPEVKTALPDTGMNKRCSNKRLSKLGYRFIYPDYRIGYSELV